LTSGFWDQLGQANAPLAAGWVALEKVTIAVFGNTEWALRLPEVLSLPSLAGVTYVLARRWLGVAGSLLTTGALVLNGPIDHEAVQLKPYVLEALLTVTALLLWCKANEPERRVGRRLTLYAGVGLCSVFATPVVFVVGPLLLVDVCRAVRAKQLARGLAAVALAGGLGLAHLAVFVLRQSGQAHGTFWAASFLPHTSPAAAVRFLRVQVLSFVPELVDPTLRLNHPAERGQAVTVSLIMVVSLCAGSGIALWNQRVRPLLVAPAGALALQLAASALRLWPFGFNRTNLFLVPLLYLLGGIGIARPAGVLARRVGVTGARPTERWVATAALLLVGVVVVACTAEIFRASVAQLGPLQQKSSGVFWGDGMRRLVEQARGEAIPGDVAVVARAMARKGWSYYMWQYGPWASAVGHRQSIDPADTFFLGDEPDLEAVDRFLSRKPAARHVFLMVLVNAEAAEATKLQQLVALHGYRETSTQTASFTGTLVIFTSSA